MGALEEAYVVILGKSAPDNISRTELAELAVEGLAPTFHSTDLIRACRDEITSDDTLPGQTRDWADYELGKLLTEERSMA